MNRLQFDQASDFLWAELDKPSPFTDTDVAAWAAKGRLLSLRPLELAGDAADPGLVLSSTVTNSAHWPFGEFMVGWLDRSADGRRLLHIPDASFFIRLLGRAYGPVLERRPSFLDLLRDRSRLEMSITNDVLQIQLRSDPDSYSMIRHHALMLLYAALWLEEPRRSRWLELYDELAMLASARPGGRPGLAELAELEAGAFDDFRELAPKTLVRESADSLLADGHALDRILDYQLFAAAAVGLLWREYRALPASKKEAWQQEQLSDLYLRPDYLEKNWMEA